MTVKRLSVVLGCLVYTGLLITTYAEVCARIYGPAFPFRTEPMDLFILGIFLAVLPAFWLPIELKRPSQVAYWFLYLMAVNPTLWLPVQVLRRSPEQVLPFSLTIFAAFALLGLIYAKPVPVLPRLEVRPIFFYGIVLAATLGLAGLIVATTGLSFNLSLADVYDRRAAARSTSPKVGGLSYFSGTLGNCLAPLSFAIGAVQKSAWMLGAGFIGLATVFSFSGQKSVFFTPFMMLAVLWLARAKRAVFGPWLVWLASSLIVLCFLERQTFGVVFVTLAFVHRLIFTPGMLHNWYWEFFSRNENVYLADSIFSPFLHAPYERNVGPLMGQQLYQSEWMNATTGIWGHGFAHFGYLGVVFASLFAALAFCFFDAAAHRRNLVVGAMIMALFGIFWANSALHTSLFSNGVILTLLLVYTMPIAKRETDR